MQKLLKQTILFYFIGMVSLLILVMAFGGSFERTIKNPGTWLWPLIFLLPGLFTGYFIRILASKPRSLKLNMIGLLAGTIAMLSITFSMYYKEWRHERDLGNVESNRNHFNDSNGGYEREERIAFDSLEQIMGDPNSFKLTGGSLKAHDTVLNGSANTIYYVTFRYNRENDANDYKSKFAVLNSRAYLLYHDRLLAGQDYKNIAANAEKVKNEVRNAVKYIPDSLSRFIDENFGEMLYEQ